MIYDSLSSVLAYKGISAKLDAALDFIARGSMEGLQVGKHSIEGDEVYAVVSEYDAKDPSELPFEAHRRFIDIQLVLAGRELCYVAPIAACEASGPFDVEKDVRFYRVADGATVELPLSGTQFAIFFPGDVHRPSCRDAAPARVKKVVIKVAVGA